MIKNIFLSFFVFVGVGCTTTPVVQYNYDPVFIGSYTSDIGETKLSFIKRLGRVMDEHTKKSGHEVCGVIGYNEQTRTYSVRLSTLKLQRGCSMTFSDLNSEHVFIGETIHSHPRLDQSLYLDARELNWNRMHGNRVERVMLVKPGFSPADFSARPGWLVESGHLYFQSKPPRGKWMGLIAEHTTLFLADNQQSNDNKKAL